MATPTVLIIGDNPGMRLGIKSELIKAGTENISEIINREEIISGIKQMNPEIIILGDHINSEFTLELVGQIRNTFHEIKILVSGSCCHEIIIWTYLELGVNGYVVNENILTEIAFAVQAIVNGGVWISPSILAKVLPKLLEGKELFFLSKRELSILYMLSKGKKDIEIAKSLKLSERTIRYGLKAIFMKINVDTKIQAVYWAATQGLI